MKMVWNCQSSNNCKVKEFGSQPSERCTGSLPGITAWFLDISYCLINVTAARLKKLDSICQHLCLLLLHLQCFYPHIWRGLSTFDLILCLHMTNFVNPTAFSCHSISKSWTSLLHMLHLELSKWESAFIEAILQALKLESGQIWETCSAQKAGKIAHCTMESYLKVECLQLLIWGTLFCMPVLAFL